VRPYPPRIDFRTELNDRLKVALASQHLKTKDFADCVTALEDRIMEAAWAYVKTNPESPLAVRSKAVAQAAANKAYGEELRKAVLAQV